MPTRSSKASRKTYFCCYERRRDWRHCAPFTFQLSLSQRVLFSHSKNNLSTTLTPTKKPRYTYCRVFFVDSIYSKTIDIIRKTFFSIFRLCVKPAIRLTVSICRYRSSRPPAVGIILQVVFYPGRWLMVQFYKKFICVSPDICCQRVKVCKFTWKFIWTGDLGYKTFVDLTWGDEIRLMRAWNALMLLFVFVIWFMTSLGLLLLSLKDILFALRKICYADFVFCCFPCLMLFLCSCLTFCINICCQVVKILKKIPFVFFQSLDFNPLD